MLYEIQIWPIKRLYRDSEIADALQSFDFSLLSRFPVESCTNHRWKWWICSKKIQSNRMKFFFEIKRTKISEIVANICWASWNSISWFYHNLNINWKFMFWNIASSKSYDLSTLWPFMWNFLHIFHWLCNFFFIFLQIHCKTMNVLDSHQLKSSEYY